MKVAIVTRELIRTTGASRNTLEQARLFAERGIQVDIWGQMLDAKLTGSVGAGAKTIYLPIVSGGWKRYLFDRFVTSAVKRRGYDLVMGNGDIIQQDVLFLHNCVRRLREVLNPGEPENCPVSRLHEKILGAKQFRLLVANSQLMKNDLCARYGLDPKIIEVVYPGCNEKQFNLGSRAELRTEQRKSIGAADNDFVISMVTSGFFRKRNVRFLIRLVYELHAMGFENVRGVIVGRDPFMDDDRKYARDLGVRSIHFLDPKPQVEEFYFAADALILPAVFEEFGLVVPEAMSCGLPVLVSDQTGAGEIMLAENAPENVLPIASTKPWLQRLSTWIEQPEERQREGERNRNRAALYSEEAQMRKLEDVLKKHKLF